MTGSSSKHRTRHTPKINPEVKAANCLWPFVYAAVLLGMIGMLNFITGDDRQYSRLAESFLEGQLSLLPASPNGWADTAPFAGKRYSALGPFPAALILPLIWAGYFHLGQLSFITTLVVFYLCFRLARKLSYSPNHSCWLALAFCFGTSFIGVAALAGSNFFAHVLTVMLLFLAINEYEGKRRGWLIGGLIGLAMASRGPAGINILFFGLAISLGVTAIRDRVTDLVKLLLPFVAIVGVLALYNFARFGNLWESGYGYQLNGFGVPYAVWSVPGNTAGPAFSLSNIPHHLWIFLFGIPSTSAIGTSVLLISPFLAYLFLVRRWDLINKLIISNVVVVLLVVLAFRSTGFEQMGYRFSLDFLPFVFWLLMRSQVRMTNGFKAMIFVATIIDVCLTASYLASGVDRRRDERTGSIAVTEYADITRMLEVDREYIIEVSIDGASNSRE